MMKILLIAATEAEIAPLIKHITANWQQEGGMKYAYKGFYVTILYTGVGMVATTYHLTKELAKNSYDLVIQAGIAGSFDRSLELGTVVFVAEEQIGDLGAENKDDFIDAFGLGLIGDDEKPYKKRKLTNPDYPKSLDITLHSVIALTNNTVSGSLKTIEQLTSKYSPQIETMEGAALHYTCLYEGVRFMQVRSISNYVEERNRENWKLFEAISFLNQWLIHYFDGV